MQESQYLILLFVAILGVISSFLFFRSISKSTRRHRVNLDKNDWRNMTKEQKKKWEIYKKEHNLMR